MCWGRSREPMNRYPTETVRQQPSHSGEARNLPERGILPHLREVRSRGKATIRKYYHEKMAFPIKTCVACGEEFELKPGKPGFANRCPSCSEEDAADSAAKAASSAGKLPNEREANEARREAMRNLLYRKDS